MKISVVMAVLNDEQNVATTIEAILAQTEPDFEFIIVNDGSTDRTPAILADFANRDARIRVITQANAGLTRALIRGCAEARAPFIAREDSGDISLPERLAAQLRAFEADDVMLVSCTARFVAPDGEELYLVERDGNAVRESFLHDDADHIVGMPGHPTAMFRRDAYLRAGGYREQFWFAQDLDLWVRLAALGRIVIVPEILHEAVFAVQSVSGRYRDEQVELANIALQLRNASDEQRAALLARAAKIRPRPRAMTGRERAKANYFLAAVLRRRNDLRWLKYAWRAVWAWVGGG
ncbi:MAG TPA: glycosyltransferase family 2 protein [Thermoanaerobaculia bacterium]|nr:glycosyltransferase family 2 protein [Thermoanaerobaculia bacterium]